MTTGGDDGEDEGGLPSQGQRGSVSVRLLGGRRTDWVTEDSGSEKPTPGSCVVVVKVLLRKC